jgi:hypothetical protein
MVWVGSAGADDGRRVARGANAVGAIVSWCFGLALVGATIDCRATTVVCLVLGWLGVLVRFECDTQKIGLMNSSCCGSLFKHLSPMLQLYPLKNYTGFSSLDSIHSTALSHVVVDV